MKLIVNKQGKEGDTQQTLRKFVEHSKAVLKRDSSSFLDIPPAGNEQVGRSSDHHPMAAESFGDAGRLAHINHAAKYPPGNRND